MTDWVVYLLRCRGGSLYCGATNDFESRLAAHRAGRGSRYVRSRLPVEPACVTKPMPKDRALRLEAFVKRLPAGQKLAYLRTFA
jgi:putative endonuclease